MGDIVKVESLAIPDVKLLTPRIFRDDRGFFSETWNAKTFGEAGIDQPFVQDNHALSRTKGTLRGLHFQTAPMAQDKLVRVIRGAIWDVAVDVRPGSPTFGRHVGAVISADNWTQIWVPKGFAHGYVTLEPDTEVIYKVTALYAPANDRGILWNDPALAIEWPVDTASVVLSEKDKLLPRLADLPPGTL
jgi:dTDP-4-dehydrorhamnose 3,5-epimerase